MSLIEGGDFRCDAKHFSTGSVEEWNNHCMNDCDLHTEQGLTACRRCGVTIEYSNLPYHPYDATGSKGISLICDECEEKTVGSVQKRSVSKPE